MESINVLSVIYRALRRGYLEAGRYVLTSNELENVEIGKGVDGQTQIIITAKDGSQFILDEQSIISVESDVNA